MSKNGGISIIILVVIILAALVSFYFLTSLLLKIKAFGSLKFHPTPKQTPELIKKKAFVTSDGYELRWYGEVKPDDEIIILGVHDFALGGKSFDQLAKSLTNVDLKIGLISFDQRNFGQNKVEDPKNRHSGAVLSDLEQILNYCKTTYPGKRLYLYGGGFGANIIVTFMKKRGYLVDGIILDSMINFKPDKNSSTTTTALVKGTLFAYTRMVKINLNSLDYNVSGLHEQSLGQNLNSFSTITVREYFQNKKLLKTSLKAAGLITKPVLMLNGGDDVFQLATKTTKFYDQISYPEKHHQWIADKKHGLFLNPNQEMLHSLIEWLKNNEQEKSN